MANNINCTCGHSWSKASSSKKDMYVCHICGKDNTMQDGGWLSKFEQGGMNLEQKGDNYGKKPNPNDVQASVGPDFVGLGYDITGRNYSPAWGGQFQDGGKMKAYQDSLIAYTENEKSFKDYKPLTKQIAKQIGQDYQPNLVYRPKEDSKGYFVTKKPSIKKPTKPTEKVEYKKLEETKSEETKPTQPTPKGSKKYIVNGMEVSEEDFLGAGAPTGGGKTVIYSTPKLEKQKVLRLDGTPETDPDKIRRALATANKKEEFQSGGFLEPISYKLPSRYRIPYAEPSTELATSIGGVDGEPAYLIPTFKGGKDLKDPVAEYRKTGEHLGGPFKTWQEAEKWEQEIRHPYVEKGKPIPTPLKRWGDMAMGGSLPGAVGFTYARVAGSAPSNGKYAKKTKASAQNGKEMKFYQEGLDFKPNSIAQDGKAVKDETMVKKPITTSSIVDSKKQALQKYAREMAQKEQPTLSNFDPLLNTSAREQLYKETEQNKLSNQLLKGADVATDLMQLGNFVPNPVGQLVGNIGNVAGGWLDAYQAYDAYNKEDYGDAAINLASVAIPMQLGSSTFRRNSKYLQPGQPLNFLKGNKRVNYIEPFTKVKGMTNKNLMANRALLGTLGAETAYDSYQDGGAIVDPMGQWAHPGEVTIIPDTNITMEGVDYPVLGISDTGDQQMMYPGEDYDFDGEYVTEYPMMKKGGWLSKYQDGGGLLMDRFKEEKAPSDATRVSAPIKPLTKKEQKENVRINKQTQKNTEEYNKAVIADRKSKKETKGDVNVPGSFNISEKLKLSNILPESWAPPGGAVDIFDEYINPGTVIGPLADSLGESIAARSPEGVAATLAMTLGAGALGFDPLGSALKSPTLKMAIKDLSGAARTIRDIPRAKNVKEAIGRIGGIPLRKDIPRMAANDVKALRQVQEIGRLRATNSSMADQMKYGLENNLPEEHFKKVFGKSKEEAQNLLNSGFGEQEAAKSANIRGSIDLRRNRGSDLDLDRSIANRPINGQQPGTPEHNALLQEINSYQNPRQTVDRSEVLNELMERATQAMSESRYRSLSSDEIINNFTGRYGRPAPTKMTRATKNFDNKVNNLVYKNIQDYPYYSGEVLQKVPSLNLSGSGSLKDVSKKVGFAPEGINSGDVFTGSTNTSHSSWLPQIKQVFKYDKGTPQFLGYQPMNSLGFLSNYGYDEKDIAKYLNSEIDEQIKRGIIPKNVSRPFQKGESVMLPQYGVRQNKNGGWLNKYK